jgi:hypothetical protein
MHGIDYLSLLTVDEAAKVLGLRGRRGLDRMRSEGRGPRFLRLGAGVRPRIRYRIADLMAYLRES